MKLWAVIDTNLSLIVTLFPKDSSSDTKPSDETKALFPPEFTATKVLAEYEKMLPQRLADRIVKAWKKAVNPSDFAVDFLPSEVDSPGFRMVIGRISELGFEARLVKTFAPHPGSSQIFRIVATGKPTQCPV